MILSVLDSACQQGFLYGLAVLGVVLSFRVLNFPDLTVDGAFALGAAVLGSLLLKGVPPAVATAVATVAGCLAGIATAFLNRKIGISKILSGILVTLMLYSLNLRIMGRANLSLLRVGTLFSGIEASDGSEGQRILLFAAIAGMCAVSLAALFVTQLGLTLRATGDNEYLMRTRGVNTNSVYFVGLAISNGLAALSGALVAQNQGFSDVNVGVGMIITCLAALIIGESAVSVLASGLRRVRRRAKVEDVPSSGAQFPWAALSELPAALVGSFLYFAVVAVALRLGLAPTDLRLATGLLVIAGIAMRLKGPMVETYARSRL